MKNKSNYNFDIKILETQAYNSFEFYLYLYDLWEKINSNFTRFNFNNEKTVKNIHEKMYIYYNECEVLLNAIDWLKTW
jgi:hypothetical protein